MKDFRCHIKIGIVLGFLALASLGLGHLALTDIAHGEADLALEWNVLRAAALVILVFATFSLVTFGRLLRRLKALS
jgi:hypothetical protein